MNELRLGALFEYARILNSFSESNTILYKEIKEVVDEIRRELNIEIK